MDSGPRSGSRWSRDTARAMSQENVELIRSMYDMLPAGDFALLARDEEAMAEVMAALEQIVDPEVEVSLVGPSYTQIRETRRGIAGYAALWRDWLRPFHSYRIELEKIIDLGDRVLVLTRATARVESDSPEIVNAGATSFRVRDRRVITVDSFVDRDEALEAVGLSE
jgi:ketosteroid isomerase-like protein